MLIIINAVKAITRSIGRNALILLIVAVIAGASSVALAIRHAAADAETTGLGQLTITATIQLDRAQLFQGAGATPGAGATADPATTRGNLQDILSQYPDLTLDQLQNYANSSYVEDFRYSASLSADVGGDLSPVTTGTATQTTPNGTDPASGQSPRGGGFGGFAGGPTSFNGRSLGDLTITGYGSESAMTSFASGAQQITDGTMIDLTKGDDACLVSDEFATFNSLAVGDQITVVNPAADTETYTLTIAGIYHSTDSTTSGGTGGNTPIFSTSQDSANRIIVSYPTVAAITQQSASVATDTTDSRGNTISTALTSTVSSTYVFADPADYDSFSSEIRAEGLDDAYSLTSTDVDTYEASLVPLKNLASFAQTLLWIVLGVGAVVLVTIAVFSIRERKYEVGVLTAIGIAKPKVALQFIVETFLVTIVGLALGLGIGAAASVPVANNLLSSQVAQEQAQTQSLDENFGRGPGGGGGAAPGAAPGGAAAAGPAGRGAFGRTVDYISQINATVDWSVVAQLAGIGLGLAIIASAAGVIFVMRYEPLTILANRS